MGKTVIIENINGEPSILIDEKIVEQLGIGPDSWVDISTDGKSIIITPVNPLEIKNQHHLNERDEEEIQGGSN